MKLITRFLANSRLWFFYSSLVALCLVAGLVFLSPVQMPVAVYKLCLLMLSGIAGFCIDRAFFPYAEPSSYLDDDWRREPDADRPEDADFPIVREYHAVFVAAMARQAFLIAVSMMAVGLGL